MCDQRKGQADASLRSTLSLSAFLSDRAASLVSRGFARRNRRRKAVVEHKRVDGEACLVDAQAFEFDLVDGQLD